MAAAIQGHLAHKTPPPQDPTVALCLGTYGDLREVGVSYERGTPVPRRKQQQSETLSSASEPRGNNSQHFKDFNLKAKASLWP